MSPATYAYYPGCALHSTAKEYDVSTKLVTRALGIELWELEDWICCGASSAHTISKPLSISLPSYELLKASKQGLPLVTSCAMCFSRLKFSAKEIEDPETREMVGQVLGEEVPDGQEVNHLLEVLSREEILVKRSLSGLRIACYYGCLLTRPASVTQFDDNAENPQIMDRLLRGLGAETLDWPFKTECCGAGMLVPRRDIVLKLSHRLLYQARQAGANCLAVACPMCHSNLDLHQREVRSRYGDHFDLPVIYFTQLIGLAMGFSPAELLMDHHFSDPMPLMREQGWVKKG